MNDLVPYVHTPEHYKEVQSEVPYRCCDELLKKYVHTGPGFDLVDLQEMFYSCDVCTRIFIPVG